MKTLEKFLMPQEQKELRRLSIGGSDANTIMSGDQDRLQELWEQKMGRGKADVPTLPMLIGTVTEELNAAWYSHQTGDPVSNRSETRHKTLIALPMHATLDGIARGGAAIWEAKHTSSYDFQAKERRTIAALAEYYFPQLQHNMYVTGMQRAVLSAFFDNSKWECVEIEADPFYQDALIEREREFWHAVTEKKPPKGGGAEKGDVKIIATKTVDMTGNNEWANFAATWLETKAAAEKHADSLSGLKTLVEADVQTCKGHGVIAKRDKRGAIRVSVL